MSESFNFEPRPLPLLGVLVLCDSVDVERDRNMAVVSHGCSEFVSVTKGRDRYTAPVPGCPLFGAETEGRLSQVRVVEAWD